MKTKFECIRCKSTYSYFNHITYDGVCGACIAIDELKDKKKQLVQEKILLETLGNSRNRKNRTYDCIVPARGDAEDYFIVNYLLKNKFNPLIVLVNNYFLNDLAWANFHNLITVFDVDSIVYNPNLTTYKEAVRSSLRKLNSIYYPYKALLHSYVMRLASEKNIPFVVWGQCQPLEFNGKFSKFDRLRLTEWWIIEHELGGVNFERFLGSGVQITDLESNTYKYPSKNSLKDVQGLFLSNYLYWDQGKQNQSMTEYGFISDNQSNTFDGYENAGSSVYYQFHDLLRLINTGSPKIEQQFWRERRFGRIDPEINPTNFEVFLSYNPKSFFSDFLETTNSGYEWFVSKRITNYQGLLREEPEENINKLLNINSSNSNKVNHNFVKFKKGIS